MAASKLMRLTVGAAAAAALFGTQSGSAIAAGTSQGTQWLTSVSGAGGAAGTLTFGGSGETAAITAQTQSCGGNNQVPNATLVSLGAAPYYVPPAPNDAVGVIGCMANGGANQVRTVTLSKPVLDPIFYVNNLDASTLDFSAGPSGGAIQLTTVKKNPNFTLTGGTHLADTFVAGSAGCADTPPSPNNDSGCGSFQMTQAGGAVSDFTLTNIWKPTAGSGDGWFWSLAIPTATLTKAFSPTSILPGGTSTLTFTVANTSATDLGPMGFTDTLPGGLTIADGGTSDNGSCGSETVTDASGGGLGSGDTGVKVAGMTVTAGSTCTITVDVTASASGNYTNDNSNLTTTVGNLVPNASTTLQVVGNVPNITCTSNSAIFNTAYDAATNGILPDGSIDAHWQVAGPFYTPNGTTPATLTSLPPANASFGPAVVGKQNGLWATSPFAANWISQAGTGGSNGDWYYRYQFSLDPGVNASTLSLAMDWLADNDVAEVYVNGVPQSGLTTGLPQDTTNPYGYGGFLLNKAASTTLNHSFQTGLNTIIVEIKSFGPAEGFLAQIRPTALCSVNLSVTKQVSPNPYDAGQKLTYTVKVTNSGPGAAVGATVSDPLPAALAGAGFTWTCTATSGSSCTASGSGDINDTNTNVAVGGTLTYTVTGTVPTGASGTLTNTATVIPPPGTVDPGCSPNCTSGTTDTQAHPAVSLTKEADVTPAGDQSAAKVGDVITYRYTVKNTGDDPLTSVSVNDPTIGQVNCDPLGPTGLPPGASVSCTAVATHLVTQADVDAGSIVDTATATGTDQAGANPTSQPAKATVDTVAPAPSLLLTKDAKASLGGGTPIKVGETIQYSYTVTNTGNVDMTSIAVSDPTAGATTCDPLPPAGLAPGATVNCKANNSYTVTQADVDAGNVVDTATASGKDPKGGAVDSNKAQQQVPGAPQPLVQITKKATVTPAADQDAVKAGDTIAYSYVVTNIGNVTLKSVSVDDPSAGATSCDPLPPGGLAPGATVNCKANNPHTVTQADVDAGEVIDTATATGTDTQGDRSPKSDPAQAKVLAVAPVLSDSIKKVATVTPGSDQNAVKVGDTIRYTYTVTNTGNVDQPSVTVNDPTIGTVTCQTPALPGLAPGQSEPCTADHTYTVTQADVDAGKVLDTATATPTGPSGEIGPPSPPDKVAVDAQTPNPTVSIVKHASVTPAVDEDHVTVGDLIHYTYDIKNTGNVTLRSVSVDDFGGVTCPPPDPPGLAPNATETCTGNQPHLVTQADVDNGKVVDTATATGTDTNGNVSPTSAPSTAIEHAVQANPQLTIVKIPFAHAGIGTTLVQGQTITYTYFVKNTGNVTLTGVGVTDSVANQNPVSCPQPTLAPDESEECTAANDYTVTANDAAAGTVSDTADAVGTAPNGAGVDAADSQSVPASAHADLSVTKTATVTPPNDRNDLHVGDHIAYSYVVTNTGNVTLTTLTVTDPTAGTLTCDPIGAGLSPGHRVHCTSDSAHIVTQSDVDAGKVPDHVTADGSVGGLTAHGTDDATVYSQPAPEVSLTKTAAVSPAADQNAVKVGDKIAYSYAVKNTGNVTLASVDVTDSTIGHVTCDALGTGGLAPGDTVQCHADTAHTVTQADVDTGSVFDQATAIGTDKLGNTSPPGSAHATVDAAPPNPSVSIKKHGTVAPGADQAAIKVGDTIAYTYDVTNTGNVTLSAAQVTDPTLGPVTCPAPSGAGLAPGGTITCTGTATHTVTQADVDDGATDRATAIGIDPKGPPTPEVTDILAVPSAAHPAVKVVKTAAVVPRADQHAAKPGDHIVYTFTVTNTGNVDLGSIAVSDPSLGQVSCPTFVPPGLAPGKSATCRGEIDHIVGNGDAAKGKVTNSATATGTDNHGQKSQPSSRAVAGVPVAHKAQALKLRKLASLHHPRAGQNVTYTLVVTNPGTIAITHATVCDALPPALVYVRSSPRSHPSGSRRCWTIAKLAGHKTRRLRLVANVATRKGGTITNHATAAAPGLPTARAKATVKAVKAPSAPCAGVSQARSSGGSRAHTRPPTAHATC